MSQEIQQLGNKRRISLNIFIKQLKLTLNLRETFKNFY